LLKNSNSKVQQQKLAFLERNMDQLTNVQKQLVEQNNACKKEIAVSERKLITRNERIQNLEALLQESQSKLESQNQKFEAQMASMRERLQDAQCKFIVLAFLLVKLLILRQFLAANPQNSSWLYSSRIAKPLRGGGGEIGDESESKRQSSLYYGMGLFRNAMK
jgi:kinesin family member 5